MWRSLLHQTTPPFQALRFTQEHDKQCNGTGSALKTTEKEKIDICVCQREVRYFDILHPHEIGVSDAFGFLNVSPESDLQQAQWLYGVLVYRSCCFLFVFGLWDGLCVSDYDSGFGVWSHVPPGS